MVMCKAPSSMSNHLSVFLWHAFGKKFFVPLMHVTMPFNAKMPLWMLKLSTLKVAFGISMILTDSGQKLLMRQWKLLERPMLTLNCLKKGLTTISLTLSGLLFKELVCDKIIAEVQKGISKRFEAVRSITSSFSFLWTYQELDDSKLTEKCGSLASFYSDVVKD